MHIQINTDSNIEGHEEFAIHVTGVVERVLSRFSDRITRVEVHLSDQNSDKSGQDDKRCMMEARLEGRPPTAVTHQAASLGDAVDGAADKLKRSLESTLERLEDARRTCWGRNRFEMHSKSRDHQPRSRAPQSADLFSVRRDRTVARGASRALGSAGRGSEGPQRGIRDRWHPAAHEG